MRELTNDHMKIISGGNANSGYDSKEHLVVVLVAGGEAMVHQTLK